MDEVDRAVLEAAHLKQSQRLEVGVQLDLGVAGYHQRLNALLDNPEAAAEYPTLVGRLRRVREQRRAARSSARIG